MVSLAPETEVCLKEAGWRPDRRWRRLKSARFHVERYGHRLSVAAIDFLLEFGGLSVRQGSVPAARGRTQFVRFDPITAAHDLNPSALEDYERDIGLPVSIVGQADGRVRSVLVADDGRVFLAFDDDVQCIGDDRYDALNFLCVGPDYNVERARRHLRDGRLR